MKLIITIVIVLILATAIIMSEYNFFSYSEDYLLNSNIKNEVEDFISGPLGVEVKIDSVLISKSGENLVFYNTKFSMPDCFEVDTFATIKEILVYTKSNLENESSIMIDSIILQGIDINQLGSSGIITIIDFNKNIYDYKLTYDENSSHIYFVNSIYVRDINTTGRVINGDVRVAKDFSLTHEGELTKISFLEILPRILLTIRNDLFPVGSMRNYKRNEG